MSKGKFNTIYHRPRQFMGLSLIEYCVADSIDKMANGRSKYHGWCNASKKYLARTLGITLPTVYKALNKLEEKNSYNGIKLHEA